MLTQEIKKKIDSARDILVGKVPDPKAQVEQITTALIYKFMDDMDKESMSLPKGKARFFTNGYEKYAWTKLMDPKVGGHERLNLYSEAITRMSRNPNLPQLFREIFKDAFLPYRDPETLNLFLKEINGFSYDNSENLGDAYEYLLSILGSQGEAGQFRTPRHIIDFIVEVVDPKNDESILDPACGTAGFLISAYKHILNSHTDKPLTPDEKKRLMMNLVGYDISPDMVRISLVNMYLHGFPNPNIYEYDTLTSEERWDDRFDVIMANPPFMTPKGGIRPHKRFAVQANRSEVLFVDYIIEHLNIKGRAGLIVPEGIIFQSSNAYKQLRRKLLEDGLYVVVSLPAGVFNPYSGVKTSVLFFDNDITKRTKDILFLKILNDGFDLGAQRRPIYKNDLPTRLDLLKRYKKVLYENKIFNIFKDEEIYSSIVKKEKIAENGDYNLSADRYLAAIDYTNAKWPMVELQEVCDLESGSRQKGGAVDKGVYSIGGEQISENNTIRFEKMKYITEAHFAEMKKGILFNDDVLMVKDGATTGKMGFWSFDHKAAVNEHVYIFRAKKGLISPKMLFNLLKSEHFQESLRPLIKGIIGGVSSEIKRLQIPLPPIEVQKEIVGELDGYQNIITGAKQIAANWKPKIDYDPDWKKVKLGEVCDVRDGTHDSPKQVPKGYPLITSKNIKHGQLDFSNVSFISEEDFKKVSQRSYVDIGDIIMPMIGTIGGACLVKSKKKEFAIKNVALFKKSEQVIPDYLLSILDSDLVAAMFEGQAVGATQQFVSLGVLRGLEIPLPTIEIQRQIVEKIEAERALVESAKKLIDVYENKSKSRIAEVWGD